MVKALLTKPCRRVDRGCTRLVEAMSPGELTKRLYCSVRCAVVARIEAGWQPHAIMTPESRRRGGQRGGKLAGVERRRMSALRIASDLSVYLRPSLTVGLTADQLARVKALLVRAYRAGYKTGYHSGNAIKVYRQRHKPGAQRKVA
jgi:hypothetical protein